MSINMKLCKAENGNAKMKRKKKKKSRRKVRLNVLVS